MGLEYKINIIDELKKRGFSTYKIRKEKIFGEKTLQDFRKGKVVLSAECIEKLCDLLAMQPGNIIEYKGGSNGIPPEGDYNSIISCLLSPLEVQRITALLQDGQTVEEYCTAAIMKKVAADELKAREDPNDFLAVARRLSTMTRDDQDEAMGLKKKR